MIVALWMAVARRNRLAVIVGALVALGATAALVIPPTEPRALWLGLCIASVAWFVGMAFVAVAVRRRIPPDFVVSGAALSTPRLNLSLIFALFHFMGLALLIGAGLWPLVHEDVFSSWWVALIVALTAPLASYLRGLWCGIGVVLSPDGIRSDRFAGTLTIPWAALTDEQPLQPEAASSGVRLAYAWPDLVRRTGIVARPDHIMFDGTHQRTVADTIAYYAAHPQWRPAIGTASEHERLRDTLAAMPPRGLALQPAPTRWKITGTITGAATAAVIAAVTGTWLTESVRTSAGVIAALLVLTAASDMHTRHKARREESSAGHAPETV
jgi:hypothetical protein